MKKLFPVLKTGFIGLVIAVFMIAGCGDSSTSNTTTTDTTKSATDSPLIDTANTRPVKTPDSAAEQ